MTAEKTEIQIADINAEFQCVRADDRGNSPFSKVPFQLASFVRKQTAAVRLHFLLHVRPSVGDGSDETFDLLT